MTGVWSSPAQLGIFCDETSSAVPFSDHTCQAGPLFGSRLKRNNRPETQPFVPSPTSANRGFSTSLNYSSSLPQDCRFRQPVWNFRVGINELILLTLPIVPQRKVTLPEIILLKKNWFPCPPPPPYALKTLSVSVALWSSFLLAGRGAARFMNPSVRPIRPLKFVCFNLCCLTL